MIRIVGRMLLFIILSQSTLIAQTKLPEAQKKKEKPQTDNSFKGFVFPSHDSILHINLGTIEVIAPFRFVNKKQEKKYHQLEIDVLKTYPLALIVGSELKLVNKTLDTISGNPSKKKIYIKWYEHYVYATYIDSLKTLNVRQGRLLLKLIHRETTKTPYELIKSYRGGLNAIFWQSAAFIFGGNLNSTYDPETDAMVEHIIRRYKAGEFL